MNKLTYDAGEIAEILGISKSKAYDLLHRILIITWQSAWQTPAKAICHAFATMNRRQNHGKQE